MFFCYNYDIVHNFNRKEPKEKTLANQTIQLSAPNGLHARPVKQIINFLESFTSTVHISYNGKVANAKSMISLLTLGIKNDPEIEIAVEGDNATEELSKFVDFLQSELKA